MPYVPFHLFRILLVALMIGAQVVIYRLSAKYVITQKSGIKHRGIYIASALLVINLPSVLIHFRPDLFYHGLMRTYVMMPFYAYETFTVAVLLVWLIAVPIGMVTRWLRKVIDMSGKSDTSSSRRLFIRNTAMGLGAYTFIGSLHSIYTRDDYRIERVKLQLKKLSPALTSLSILMISDVHAGMYMLEDDMLKYTEAINNLNPDVIFIPGDFVTSRTDEIYPFVKAFSGLKAKYGIYTCLGNHDFFADPDVITDEIRKMGMQVLRNETEELEWNGTKIMLSGVDDGRHANFKKVTYEASSLDTTRILLCHKPYFFETAAAGKFDLTLSGHTHGGQIVLFDALGVKITPAALASPYVSGKYRMGDSLMYVSRGIGTVGLPVRVNCPPEITVFSLTQKT